MSLGATLAGLSIVAGGLAWTPEPRPGRDTLVLRWSGPASCPTAEHVAGRVEGLLGPEDRRPAVGGIVVEGRVTEAEDGHSLELRLETASGSTQRRMSSPSCEVLAEATALAVAIAFEVEANAEEALARTQAVAHEPPPAPEPLPPPRRVGLALDALAAFEYGARPRPGFGIEAQARATLDRWQVGVRGLVLPERAAPPDPRGVVGHYMLWAVGPQGCFVPRWNRIELAACVFAEAGQLRGRATGVARPTVAAPLWVSAGAGLALVVRLLPTLGLRIGADGAGHLRPLSFTVDGEQVHRPHPAAVRATAGLELRLDGR